MCNIFPLVFLCGSVEDVVQDCTIRSFGFVGVFKAPVSCVLGSVVSRQWYSLLIAQSPWSTAQARA